MAQLNPYLIFKGNCLEAMNYYKECLGGNLTVQTIGESPMAAQFPAQSKDYILHSTLEANAVVIMGSDMFGQTFSNGDAYHLSVNCDSESEINTLFSKLAEGGTISQPLGAMPWGAIYGSVIDKFGKSWLFNYSMQ